MHLTGALISMGIMVTSRFDGLTNHFELGSHAFVEEMLLTYQ